MIDSSESARRGGSSASGARVLNGSGTGRRGDEFKARLSEGERAEERSRSGESFSEEAAALTSKEADDGLCLSDSDGRDKGPLLSLFEKVSRRCCTDAPKSSCASLVPAAAASSTSSSVEASRLHPFASSSGPFSCRRRVGSRAAAAAAAVADGAGPGAADLRASFFFSLDVEV